MQNNDIRSREELRTLIQKAVRDNDAEAFQAAFDEMLQRVGLDVQQEYENRMNDLQQELDSRILAARGVRQLTSEERSYYQKLGEAMKATDPRQAVTGMDAVLPKTVIDSVFDDLRTNHPLLSRINFMATGGAVEIIVNTNGYEEAAWGDLCDDIVKELTSGFKKINAGLYKLSAFMPVCKAMLDLGPEWLDNYVRQVLFEAFANGMEAGIVTGDGNKKPIGMDRQVGDNVTVTGNAYPKKAAVKVSDLTPATVGNLISIMAADPNGKTRRVQGVILLVNPQDYYQKVMPATTVQAPDGTYRNDVLPYPMDVIQSVSLPRGEAIIGIASQYLAMAGTSPNGKIEYSDHYHFLEDERVYLVKGYANGMPKDNNAFLRLDISGLQPATWKVTQVTAPTPSDDATLSALTIGSQALTPTFAAATVSYTATTTNATNTITAVPSDAGAEIHVLVNNAEIDNGTAATWQTGSNTVKVNVTAADGTTTKTYTVTVTKS
nr:MAG TPA: major capsid protein [Caudoviricetes sp.]DAH38224.1 MAG TPA: major capsid protein [Caudoviricetes sp.]